ncbi:MAG: hypothetical protein M4579_002458 [Chaenotheca gracillima]|nr:MAG: hypothetical protein M4579_002458 [Chaenotheca gracillima]
MLKSTHRSSNPQSAGPPLPPGWTEHKAPTGHSYYYNADTKQSTYTRPSRPPSHSGEHPPTEFPGQPHQTADSNGHFYGSNGPLQYLGFPDIKPFGGNQGFGSFPSGGRGRGGFRGARHYQERSRRQGVDDRPKSKSLVPGHDAWLLVTTRLGRRFVHNPKNGESFWKIPDNMRTAIEEIERQEKLNLEKNEPADASAPILNNEKGELLEQPAPGAPERPSLPTEDDSAVREESDEYEEVTDVEGEEGDEENVPKRQRIGSGLEQPQEFNEDDIDFQLAQMGESYGLDPGEYGHGEGDEEWEEGADGLPLNEEDSAALFTDMLDDFGINPYWTWEKIIEEGRIIEDDRYTVLPNMKSRKEVWGEWSRMKIQKLREQKEKAEKQDRATPKLYWPEFKRKYKKEPELRDTKLSDKDREKMYRDHISRLKLPESTLKSDLSKLLRSMPLSALNRSTTLADLPDTLLTDIRYISLPPQVRDPLLETYISTLEPAPSGLDPVLTEQEAKHKLERERRERALAEREKRVAADKRRQESALRMGKGRLREEEEELARAMRVGKEGLRAQLGGPDEEKEEERGREENNIGV